MHSLVIAQTDWVGIATLVGASCAGVASIIGAWRGGRTKAKVEDVQEIQARDTRAIADVKAKVENGH